MKLAVLTNIISPYRIAFFNALLASKDCETLVFYSAEQERQRKWHSYHGEIRYPYEVLPGLHLPVGTRRTLHLNIGLDRRLKAFNPDVIIIGTDILSTPASWTALAWACRHSVPVIRYEGQTALRTANRWLTPLYTAFYRRCNRFFVYSAQTEHDLLGYGVPASHIINGFNVGDTTRFREEVPLLHAQPGFTQERQKYPQVLFLFVGQLIPRKGVELLLHAWLEAGLTDAGLVLIGDGPLRTRVDILAQGSLRGRLFPLGFLQRDEIFRFYAMADVFVLPSLFDPASIALGEALHSGLFCVASTHDGSTGNFIIEGVNGLSIDPLKPGTLCQALRQAADWARKNKSNARAEIREGMADYTVERYADRLAQLARSLTTEHMRRTEKRGDLCAS